MFRPYPETKDEDSAAPALSTPYAPTDGELELLLPVF